MKKLILLLSLIAVTQPLVAMDYLFCCRRKAKQKARQEWVDMHKAQDLEEIGINCTTGQFKELPYQQQLLLSALKSAHVAVKNFDEQLIRAQEKAPDFPAPFKTQLTNFCANQIAVREFAHRIVIVHAQEGQ